MTRKILPLFVGSLLSCAVLAEPAAELQTSLGKIVVDLDAGKAPKSVQNFVQYANEGFYN
ncbi:MAG TPA: peptidylprolyl isomerase, partial [Accumulibacter sp.]|nr:peptidylprolyl isomerase [Accumulibacter sp.]